MVKQNKKAAMELSIGTIVILVLAMTMLILGLVLVRTIFTGAKYNVDTMNDKVRAEIEKLFVEDKRVVVYLANNEFEGKQGDSFGVAFGIRNLLIGKSGTSNFHYTISINSPNEVKANCGLKTGNEPLSWIKAGKSGDLSILPNQVKEEIIKFQIPETAPSCLIRFKLCVQDPSDETGIDSCSYDSVNFDMNIG